MVYLSVMWSTIFCAAAGAWFWYGEVVIAHLLVAVGFVVTGLTFRAAGRRASERDERLADGTAR